MSVPGSRSVRPNDTHAWTHTASVYTSTRVFAMLPKRLSTDLSSLNADQDRLAIVTERVVAPDASITQATLYRATVRSHAKLVHDALSAWIECNSRFLAAAGSHSLRRVLRSPVRCLRIVEVARRCGERLPKTPDSVALAAFLAKRHRADPLWFPRRRPRAGSSPACVGSRWASRSASSWYRRTWRADSSTSCSSMEKPNRKMKPSTRLLQARLSGGSSIRSFGFDEAGNAVVRAGLRHRLDRSGLAIIDAFDAAPSRRGRCPGGFHSSFADVRGRTIAATADLGSALHGVLTWTPPVWQASS